MGPIVRRLFLSFCLLGASAARAEYHTFQIEELFSNADGTIQYVVLHEAFGMNGENLWVGHALASGNGTSSNTFTFPNNLPGGPCGYYGCTQSQTANARVLVATQGFAALGLVTPAPVTAQAFGGKLIRT
jgi:hypothetical protein